MPPPDRTPEDERVNQLALAAGRGDRAALEAWIRATQPDVWRFVAHLAGQASADDLTQETYLRALRSLRRFAGRSSSRTWLLSIARRVVVDQRRSAAARPGVADRADRPGAVERRRAVPGHEDAVTLELLVAGLEPQRREALVLSQFLGLSYAEVAEICGCPVGTVRSRIARAREDLLRERSRCDDTG